MPFFFQFNCLIYYEVAFLADYSYGFFSLLKAERLPILDSIPLMLTLMADCLICNHPTSPRFPTKQCLKSKNTIFILNNIYHDERVWIHYTSERHKM